MKGKKQSLLLLTALLQSIFLFAQQDTLPRCYWLGFTDKNDSSYEIGEPAAFLSSRAVARRARFDIPVTEADLPVNKSYLEDVQKLGASIQYPSRWLNGAVVVATTEQITALQALPFVSGSEYIGPHFGTNPARDYKYISDSTGMKMESSIYGRSSRNIQMLNGDSLHQLGYRGDGMYIAVLDGGFTNVDKIPFFDSLQRRQDFADFYDFTDADRQVFESSTHGTSVLSAMAAYTPGVLTGTAPMARYLCLKTEEVRGEHRMEEYNWVAALEYADSLGIDVVNSSLGYYAFTDPSMNYRPEQLDGNSSPASRAAGMAFDRGMIIVVSAGNEGDNHWKYIDVPADSPKVLAIAAVVKNGERASFSSFGYDSLQMIKPDLAAPGVNIPVPNAFRNRLSAASGTSLAAPIMTGLIACLWQAFPDLPNTEIVGALKASGSQSDAPDLELGYGMPDLMKAYRLLQARQLQETTEKPD